MLKQHPLLSFNKISNQLQTNKKQKILISLYKQHDCVYVNNNLNYRMSNCIEFCGKGKKKNSKPLGQALDVQPQIAIENNERKNEYRKQEILNRLKYV